jgi:hypothetical protein
MDARPFLIFHMKAGVRLALLKPGPFPGVMFGAYFILRPEFFFEYFTFLFSTGSQDLGSTSNSRSSFAPHFFTIT